MRCYLVVCGRGEPHGVEQHQPRDLLKADHITCEDLTRNAKGAVPERGETLALVEVVLSRRRVQYSALELILADRGPLR